MAGRRDVPARANWSHFTHDADLGLRGRGATKAEAFEAIAMALTAAVTDIDSVTPTATARLQCSAPDDEILLVDWLNALVYEMAMKKMLFSRFDVSLDDGVLSASIAGEPVNRAKHQPAVEVKGATFTGLALEKRGDEWIAECVVDV